MIDSLKFWLRGCAFSGLALASSAISALGGQVDFTFTSTSPTSPITSSSGGGGLTTLTLTGRTGVGDATLPYGTDINFGLISKSSTELNATPDVFNNNYSFNITITDVASSLSTTIVINGLLTGSAAKTQSNLINTYQSPLSQTFTLGSDIYTFDVTTFANPGNPASNNGSFAGHISAIGPGVNPFPAVPEPSTLIGASCAVLVAGLMTWRRRKAG